MAGPPTFGVFTLGAPMEFNRIDEILRGPGGSRTLPGEYQVGDVVCFRRDNQKGPVWSPASRVIGKEGEDKIWVLCYGIPVLERHRPQR